VNFVERFGAFVQVFGRIPWARINRLLIDMSTSPFTASLFSILILFLRIGTRGKEFEAKSAIDPPKNRADVNRISL
jgi:hypothetical protein